MDKTKGYIDMIGHHVCVPPVEASAIATGTICVAEVDFDDIANYTTVGGPATIALQPSTPRGVVLWHTDASAALDHAGTVVVTGLDQNGVAVEETIAIPAATTHVHGVLAFSKISSVWVKTTAGTYGASDHFSLGFDNRLGLCAAPHCIYGSLIQATTSSAVDAGTFNATYGTYDAAEVFDADIEAEITFTYKIPIPN